MDIYTIGHSNVPANKIIDLLRKNGIEVLVDVRSAPYSQYAPQFNREQLAHSLGQAGLRYVFAGEYLGGRPKDPSCYKDKQLPSGKVDYLHLVDYNEVAKRSWYQKGITRLVEIAADDQLAIMCSEEDPNHCHRQHLISQTLLAMGITVVHIRGDGSLEAAKTESSGHDVDEPQQMSLFPSE
jgi:uncharacterized protein (DUF488 family)